MNSGTLLPQEAPERKMENAQGASERTKYQPQGRGITPWYRALKTWRNRGSLEHPL